MRRTVWVKDCSFALPVLIRLCLLCLRCLCKLADLPSDQGQEKTKRFVGHFDRDLGGTAANLVYTPATGFSGADEVSFQASDGQATSSAAQGAVLRDRRQPVLTRSRYKYS